MIKKVRLSDSVISAIKQMISVEGFQPGDRFYSENELTKKLEVSRSSVREAMRMLEFSGVLKVQHGRGTFVSEGNEPQLEPFSDWLRNNEQSIYDNFEVRLIIEPETAALAAKNADNDDLAKLRQCCTQFSRQAELTNTEEVISLDRRFHRLLAAATKNKTLHMLMRSMMTTSTNVWISSLYTPGRISKTIAEHNAIVAAVAEGNVDEARQAMACHLNNAKSDVMSATQTDGDVLPTD